MPRETEFQRNQRLTREAMERTEENSQLSLAIQQEHAYQSLRLQEEQNAQNAELLAIRREEQQARRDQEQARRDQEKARAHAEWLKTSDGGSFMAWDVAAHKILLDARQRSRDIEQAYLDDVNDTITLEERDGHKTNRHIPPSRRQRASGNLAGWATFVLVGFVLLAILGGLMSFFGAHPAWILPALGAAVGVDVMLWIATIATRDGEWRKTNEEAGVSASQKRAEAFGVDPITKPDWRPTWMSNDIPPLEEWSALRREAHTTHPTQSSLPPLRRPTVREPGPTDTPRVRSLLELWSAADNVTTDTVRRERPKIWSAPALPKPGSDI